MKRFLLSLPMCAALVCAGASGQPPAGVHQVYVMPMAGGLDQYLADWLTREHVMQVVADPKIADAVLTDRLGAEFEARLNEFWPPAPVVKDSKDSKEGGAKIGETAGGGGGPHTFHSGLAHGTMFLVDAKTRQVVWSDHEKPQGTSDRDLNREAERFVKKLEGKSSAADEHR